MNFGGGQVDITSGKFVFAASEAYEIEDGRLGAPVKGATLIGNGPDALTRVRAHRLATSRSTAASGTCGKDGQSVPVGVGMPTLRVDELTVGGTEAVTRSTLVRRAVARARDGARRLTPPTRSSSIGGARGARARRRDRGT